MRSQLLLFLMIMPFFSKADTLVYPQRNENGKWGLVDTGGKSIVKFEYNDIEDLGNGQFRVAVGGKVKEGILEGEKWGVIDTNGNYILKACYDEIGDFINGLATITSGDKIGFVDANWRIVVEPKYDFVGTPNQQGFVWLNSGGTTDKNRPGNIRGGKYGIINSEGEFIIPVSYRAIGTISTNKYYYDQDQIINAKTEIERLMLECGSQNSLWAKPIIPKDGSVLSEAIGFAFSNRDNLSFNGITDLSGKIIIKNDMYQRCAMPSEGFALVTTKDNHVGFHDVATDKIVSNKAIKSAFSFDGDITVGIDVRNKWHFYDKALNEKGEAYDWISPSNNNQYLVRDGNIMSILDASTLEIVATGMQYIFPISHNLMAFKEAEGGKWGYLNTDGSVALEPKYDYAYSFIYSIGYIKYNGNWGIIDSNLNEIIQPQWHNMIFPNDEDFTRIWVYDENEETPYHCLDLAKNGLAFDTSFKYAWNFRRHNDGNMYATVQLGEKFGQIDSDGNIIIPIEFSTRDLADNALIYKILHNITQWKQIHSYRFNTTVENRKTKHTIKDILPNNKWDY